MTQKVNTQNRRQQKSQSDKYSQIEKRKKMITSETKKVIGGIILQKEIKIGTRNHNEIFLSI